MRTAIRLAGGREVCFVATVDEEGVVRAARAVARGDARSVLALAGVARRGEMLLHNHPSGDLEPSGPDLEVAARLHDDGVGFGIIDNDAREVYVVVEIPRAVEVIELDVAAIDRDLGPAGAVAAELARYEDRPGQRQMAQAIATLYNEGGVGLLEAGTGIGKSLAYLVPWVSPFVARATNFQPYTPVLLGLGVYQLKLIRDLSLPHWPKKEHPLRVVTEGVR